MKKTLSLCEKSALYAHQHKDWVVTLLTEINASSIRRIAKRLGHNNHTKLAQILAGTGRYGERKADGSYQIDSPTMLEREWREAFAGVACPYLGKKQERVIHIKREECNSHALCAVPTSSPARMEHWQACQNCGNKSNNAKTTKECTQ